MYNKKYSKDLGQTLKQMEVLKMNAERDADTLTDTLNANQVLLEEFKVKDKIIKANEK